jgi:LPS export ABC transporter protein LptC
MFRIPLVVLLSFLLMTTLACSFDYDEAMVESEGPSGVPQVEVLDVRMVVVRDNRLELTAQRIATYPDEGIQEFSGMVFREYGPAGDLRLEGSSDEGLIYLDSEDIELRGSVILRSLVEDAELKSDFLYWENADRVLRSDDDGLVSARRGDGSYLEGTGLRMDGRRNVVEFLHGVTGTFVAEDEG